MGRYQGIPQQLLLATGCDERVRDEEAVGSNPATPTKVSAGQGGSSLTGDPP